MRLSNEWFTALSEDESGNLVTIYGRDELGEFIQSGKFKERVEITWKYEGDEKGMPGDALAEQMENVQEALKKAEEKVAAPAAKKPAAKKPAAKKTTKKSE